MALGKAYVVRTREVVQRSPRLPNVLERRLERRLRALRKILRVVEPELACTSLLKPRPSFTQAISTESRPSPNLSAQHTTPRPPPLLPFPSPYAAASPPLPPPPPFFFSSLDP